MALTLRKKNGLIIPKTPKLILPNSVFGVKNEDPHKEIIEKEIKKLIQEAIGVNTKVAMRRVIFFPIYKTREGEKEMSKIYLNYKTRRTEKIMSIDEIEDAGISLLEFIDYMITSGAKEIKDPGNALDIM